MSNWNGIVSLFFAATEFVLLCVVLFHLKKKKENLLAAILIFLLMGYQFLESLICYFHVSNSFVAFLAFADITFLPPTGLIFAWTIWGNTVKKNYLVYLPALFFLIYYSLTIEKFIVNTCTVFYASYSYPLGESYGFFYYAPVVITIFYLREKVKDNPGTLKAKLSGILIFAYVFISIPVAAGFILRSFGDSFVLTVIESVMCKFALSLALALTYFVTKNQQTDD